MKKNHKFNIMSDKKCKCNKKIKQNVIDRQPGAHLCYNCDRKREAFLGNDISTAREVKTGRKIGRKKGIYFIE